MSKNASWFVNRVIYFLIKDPRAANSVVNHLITTPKDVVILPFIDHPGPIARELLSKNFRSLTVCERDPELNQQFNAYVKKEFPDKKVQVYTDDLFDLSYKTWNDGAQERCASIVRESLDKLDDETRNPDGKVDNCDGRIKLLVPLLKSRYESGFLRALYYQMCLRLGLCSNAWIHYYILMSDRQHAYLEAKPCVNMRLYRSSSVLYNTIFNTKTLESYDLQKCFGIPIRKIQKTSATNNASYRSVHLVCLEPRQDVLKQLDPRAFIEFRFLVTQMMHRRTGLVVAFLDRFFDDYKGDIRHLGIEDSTRSGDMSKEQYFRLFLYLKNRADYKNSTFLQAAARSEENVFSL
uniref:Uncharacterized protein n=1 Tax=Aceria tosichella TaxID=561515 RepID=A0A6G1SP28_9ACAR